MANQIYRFVVGHTDANKKSLGHALESFTVSVATVIGTDGQPRPDTNDLKVKLSSNGKLRGSDIYVHCYGNPDREHSGGFFS
jgi:hypothetical protein